MKPETKNLEFPSLDLSSSLFGKTDSKLFPPLFSASNEDSPVILPFSKPFPLLHEPCIDLSHISLPPLITHRTGPPTPVNTKPQVDLPISNKSETETDKTTQANLLIDDNTQVDTGKKALININPNERPIEAEPKRIDSNVNNRINSILLRDVAGFSKIEDRFSATSMKHNKHARRVNVNSHNYKAILPNLGMVNVKLITFNNIKLTSFQKALTDPDYEFNPRQIGFIPEHVWENEEDRVIPFGYVVSKFFQRCMSIKTRFEYKLYNALRLTSMYPHFEEVVGVFWISNTHFLVHKFIFAQLLGIVHVDGSLFHKQGNFPTHGFCEATFGECAAQGINLPRNLNNKIFKILYHKSGHFTRDMDTKNIDTDVNYHNYDKIRYNHSIKMYDTFPGKLDDQSVMVTRRDHGNY